MNEDAKKRYEYLKKKQHEQIKLNKWRHNKLFMEFVKKIKEIEIISDDECKPLIDKFSDSISFYSSGHIDWNDSKWKKNKVSYLELGNYVDSSKDYYVIWDNYDLPIVKCKLQSIINNADDIEAVAFSYFIISEDFKVLMESEKFGFLNLCIIDDMQIL